jgi:dihydrofolate synthase/folylpolyglutamate synthase
MNYTQVLDYLYSQLPMFHRVGAAAYKPGLDTTYALLQLCGNPHQGLQYVHIAGTNGKGSTSHSLASVLQEAGYKTGLCTSPHLKDFRERIRINGQMMPQEAVVEFVMTYKDAWQTLKPSFFEITMAMAFWYFQKEKVEIAVLETGMGGRLDSTNVITPEVAVITNIGMDHVQFLGDTIEQIAAEKAGIIKAHVPIVTGKMRPEARAVIERIAAEKQAPLMDAAQLSDELIPPFELKGQYQQENKRTAFATVLSLQAKGWKISAEHIAQGFARITANTGLMGRWQTLHTAPLTIADVAHNEDGITWVVKQLQELHYQHLHFVLGMVSDKDIAKILSLLPKVATYYFCKADIPRGLDATLLKEQAATHGLKGDAYPSVPAAYQAAQAAATTEDLVFIGGSIFTVAEVV